MQCGGVVHTCNPSTQEAEQVVLEFWTSLHTQRVQGHPELYREIQSQKNKAWECNSVEALLVCARPWG
jgi:hypothetical protein